MGQDNQHTAEQESVERNTSDHDSVFVDVEKEFKANSTSDDDSFFIDIERETEEYNAEREEVERHISDDDREFDVCYLHYAYGGGSIEHYYNPHEFDSITRIRFLKWIQCQLEKDGEAFWNNTFFHHHNVRQMYTAWKAAT
jgi:hypothetical protein